MNTTSTELIEQSPAAVDLSGLYGLDLVAPDYGTAAPPPIINSLDTFGLMSARAPNQHYWYGTHFGEINSTKSIETPEYWKSDPFSFVDYISSFLPETRQIPISNRITDLIRAYQTESEEGGPPSLLSIKDFFCFMQSADEALSRPSLTISARGLLRSEWAQNRERVIVQFRGDEDVDYVVVVHHPKHQGRFERKAGRCAQSNLLDNLSARQQRLLFHG